MQVELKLYATLGRFLPPDAQQNAIKIDVTDGTSVRDVLNRFHVPMETCHLILVNGIFAPPANASEKILQPGDTLAVWPQVAGG